MALQWTLLDRRVVLSVLDAIDVASPRRLIANRDGGPQLPSELIELLSRDFNFDLGNPSLFARETVRMVDDDTLQVTRGSPFAAA